MTEPALRLIDLQIKAGSRLLLGETTIAVPAGKITVIVGASGAGKSVLLRVLAGLLPPDSETLSWSGQVEAVPGSRVGIVFQQFALFDELSAQANVQFAIDHRADRSQPPGQTSQRWLQELNVPAGVRVANLSGGQKQRLAIARTLAADPQIILYDEPTSGLDSASGQAVAALIRRTHLAHQRTSIIVTHDYETLLPIAEAVFLFDSARHQLRRVDRADWTKISEYINPVAWSAPQPARPTIRSWIAGRAIDFLTSTGAAAMTVVRLPIDLLPIFPRPRWGLRFWLHYLRLVGGPSAWVYLGVAGLIVGFTTTYFTLRFLPFRLYTQPLLIDELLASIGFALYRILVPVLATILIAARCGAAVAADVGVKQYNGQIDAFRTLGVTPQVYLLVPIVLAFVAAAPVLQWLAFGCAQLTSLVTFSVTHADIGPHFWQQHFDRNLETADSWWRIGWKWVLLKNLVCGIGTGVIGYHLGAAPKDSATDVSRGITATVLWATLLVLVVHFVVALLEF